MSLTHWDLLQPKGELWLQLWPGLPLEDLYVQLDQYLVEGAEKAADMATADQEAGQKAWGYYRAYHGVYLRMAATPASAETKDQSKRDYDPKQADKFLALANGWLAVFEELLPAESAQSTPASSFSFRHALTW